MPAIRPEAISNCIRLTYEFRAAVRGFVTEDSAVDPFLRLSRPFVDALVDEFAPDPSRITFLRSQDDLGPRPAKQLAPAAVTVLVRRVVALVEREDGDIAILREPPEGRAGLIHRDEEQR